MKLGFIVAMEEEFNALTSVWGPPKPLSTHPIWPVVEFATSTPNLTVLALLSGIGKSLSAAATGHLIEHHQVDLLINLGTAGGINKEVGDIVVATSAFFHDVDVTAFNYAKGQLPGEVQVFSSLASPIRVESIIALAAELGISVKSGTIATGDQFIADLSYVEQLKALHPSVGALDMEAASVALICSKYQKPFLLIKKISDQADSSATQSFQDELENFDQKLASLLAQLAHSLTRK